MPGGPLTINVLENLDMAEVQAKKARMALEEGNEPAYTEALHRLIECVNFVRNEHSAIQRGILDGWLKLKGRAGCDTYTIRKAMR